MRANRLTQGAIFGSFIGLQKGGIARASGALRDWWAGGCWLRWTYLLEEKEEYAVEVRRTIVKELAADHREVERLLGWIQELSSGDERRRLVDQMVVELVQHMAAEKMYLYPAVRQYVLNGSALADERLEDHVLIGKLLKGLEAGRANNFPFDVVLSRLVFEVSAHFAQEERMFRDLADACSTQQLEELGDRLRSGKGAGPARARWRRPRAS